MVEQAKVYLNTNSAAKYSTVFLPFLLSVPLFCSIYETSHKIIPAYSPLESPVLLLKVLITRKGCVETRVIKALITEFRESIEFVEKRAINLLLELDQQRRLHGVEKFLLP